MKYSEPGRYCQNVGPLDSLFLSLFELPPQTAVDLANRPASEGGGERGKYIKLLGLRKHTPFNPCVESLGCSDAVVPWSSLHLWD